MTDRRRIWRFAVELALVAGLSVAACLLFLRMDSGYSRLSAYYANQLDECRRGAH